MPSLRRAIRDEQKQQRRHAILAVAWHLFETTAYEQITMSEIAERCGLAKGTIYLYFKTKEELFLALQEQQLEEWFADLDARLAAVQGTCSAAHAADLFCATLEQRPLLTRLLAMLHSHLEQNIDFDTALRFKQMLRSHMMQTGALLEARLPFLAAGEGAQVLLRAQALVIGFRHLADPAPPVRQVLREPDMEPFIVDFAREFSATFTALLFGLEQAARQR